MLVDFKTLSDDSRIWIYQSNRSFSEAELVEVRQEINNFLQIPYNRFIVFGLDQTQTGASGCSIDASVRFIQALEKKYSIDLLDKMNVSYKQGEFVAYKTLLDFKKMAKNKSVSKNTIVFNNLVTNKDEYLNHWEVPAEESWHNRFM